jgi:hypothetical protein
MGVLLETIVELGLLICFIWGAAFGIEERFLIEIGVFYLAAVIRNNTMKGDMG